MLADDLWPCRSSFEYVREYVMRAATFVKLACARLPNETIGGRDGPLALVPRCRRDVVIFSLLWVLVWIYFLIRDIYFIMIA